MEEKEGKRSMTCSVISVLCIRPRLIYREPRRGTGCAPGAHPGPSHASALPAYPLRSPLPPLGSFSLWYAFLFAPVLPSFDLSERKGSGSFLSPFLASSLFSFVPRVFPESSFFMFLRLFSSQWSLRDQHRSSTSNHYLYKL